EKICICKCEKLSYNNKNCCYLQPKDICIAQVNDPKLFQIITDNQNLYLTAAPLEINTSSYKIESSVIQRPNDTLTINELGIYSIYVSLKYNFKFNENAKEGNIFRVDFKINGNNEEIFSIENTIIVPSIDDEESEEISNTIQGTKLQVVEENFPYKINISLKKFGFDLTVLNQIIISDLILIVEKII
ncbi:hypothetical protein, partial [Clostridioides difficile]|uniref:hypothetical protein n=1 Tax=Clostridioides difficile TaxID=1496 RepID=UPI00235876D5